VLSASYAIFVQASKSKAFILAFAIDTILNKGVGLYLKEKFSKKNERKKRFF
jgi:hypothetical protein